MGRFVRAWALAAVLAVLAAGCGGDSGDDEGSRPETAEDTSSTTEGTSDTTEGEAEEGPDLDPSALDVCSLATPADFKAVTGLDLPDAEAKEEMGARSCVYVASGKGGSVGVNLGTPPGDEWKTNTQPGCANEELELDGTESVLVTCDAMVRVGFKVRGALVFVVLIRGLAGDAGYLDEATAKEQVQELGQIALDRARAA